MAAFCVSKAVFGEKLLLETKTGLVAHVRPSRKAFRVAMEKVRAQYAEHPEIGEEAENAMLNAVLAQLWVEQPELFKALGQYTREELRQLWPESPL